MLSRFFTTDFEELSRSERIVSALLAAILATLGVGFVVSLLLLACMAIIF